MQKINQIYISQYEALTESGFLSKNIAKILDDGGRTVVACLPDFNAINSPNYISKIQDNKNIDSKDIDTIIQYVPTEISEYHSNYKNIIIYNPPHFITKNKSIIDKISVFDEVWTFDKNSLVFMDCAEISSKIKIVGYPYIPSEMRTLIGDISTKKNNKIVFYTIISSYQIENIENLILNFISVFNKTDDVQLVIYIDSDASTRVETDTKKMIDRIKDSIMFIDRQVLDTLVTIMSGNIWSDHQTMRQLHSAGDCYINIDYLTNPHILTAFHLNKYCLSICNIDSILEFNETNIIKTYRGSFRYLNNNKTFFNEYNIYPKILDESIKDKLISSYSNIKNGIDGSSCIQNFDYRKYFNDTNISNY